MDWVSAMANSNNETIDLGKLVTKNVLNEDCLIAIMKYLTVSDLLKVCEFDEYCDPNFFEFMTNNVMNTKEFDFTEIVPVQSKWSIRRVLKTFGKSMKSIKVSFKPDQMNQFMQEMVNYCTPGVLTDLEIIANGSEPHEFTDNLMQEARPFFHGLQKLSMSNSGRQLIHLFQYFSGDMQNLRCLTMGGFNFNESGWMDLFNPALSNLTELCLCNFSLREELSEFEQFLIKHPKLERFIHTRFPSKFSTETVANQLIMRHTKLRGFGYLANRGGFDANFTFDDTFKFFLKFEHLTELHICCFGIARDIHKVINFTPKLKVLGIWQVNELHETKVTVHKIVESIKSIIEKRKNHTTINDRIKLFVRDIHLDEFVLIKEMIIDLKNKPILTNVIPNSSNK